jgi:hypothetical protein
MKTLKYFSAAFLVVALAAVIYAKANTTFSIENDTSLNLGSVAITQQSGDPVYTNVTGTGTFYADVAGTPTAVVVNGYAIAPGSSGYAYLTVGGINYRVTVTWTSSVVVIDQSIVQ